MRYSVNSPNRNNDGWMFLAPFFGAGFSAKKSGAKKDGAKKRRQLNR
tara:strand:+ start:401 stop:541 length:141 start_codon:yes stop_codon:yes gene_type:complete